MSTPLPAVVPPSRDWASLIPVAAGLVWLSLADGPVGLLLAVLPGTLLIATGVSSLLWSGDGRITQYGALAGVLGLLLLLPALFVLSFLGTVLAGLLSVAAFLHAGRTALRLAEPAPGAPEPPADLKTWAKAALDEALVGYFVSLAKIPAGAEAESLLGGRDNDTVTGGGGTVTILGTASTAYGQSLVIGSVPAAGRA